LKLNTYNHVSSHLPEYNVSGQRVLVRADLNVPLLNSAIASDYKLQKLLPTLEYIKKQQGIIILATHMGRPTTYDPALSTRILLPWFSQHQYTTHFCSAFEEAHLIRNVDIILLENTRFFAGEKPAQRAFAQQLAQLGDYFVQDAFASLHNTDASITIITTLMASNKHTISFLIEEELNMLGHIPDYSLTMIVGGKKVASKVAYIRAMLDKIHTLVLLPPLVFTFLKARNEPVGQSYLDLAALPICIEIMQEAAIRNINVIMPHDYLITRNSTDAPLLSSPVTYLQTNDIGITCGPRTVSTIAQLCKTTTNTIIVNGLMGFLERPETLTGMRAILHATTTAPTKTIIGGGDTVALIEQMHMLNAFSYVSTGGGALLAYLAGSPLPGLAPFIEHC